MLQFSGKRIQWKPWKAFYPVCNQSLSSIFVPTPVSADESYAFIGKLERERDNHHPSPKFELLCDGSRDVVTHAFETPRRLQFRWKLREAGCLPVTAFVREPQGVLKNKSSQVQYLRQKLAMVATYASMRSPSHKLIKPFLEYRNDSNTIADPLSRH